MTNTSLDQALTFARANTVAHFAQLQDFLRIPSVSTQPDHAPDVAKAAEWLAAEMRRIGLENVEVIASAVGKHPLVYADWLHAGADAPTVLIYGHFDV